MIARLLPALLCRLARQIGLLLLLLTIHPRMIQCQPETNRKFSHLTTADGLSQSTVNCILKDRLGFMWFGTQDGLNKYDGHTFTVYRNNPKNPRSIPDNQIKCLFEDQQSNLWIGTLGGGLCIYNRSRDTFIRLEDLGIHPDFLINPAILSICEDHDAHLWVGTFHELLLIDLNKKTIRHFQSDPGNPAGLSNPVIQAIFEDASHNLWIGTSKGLNLWNPKDSTFRHFWHDDQDPRSLSSNLVKTITEDPHGRLWIGTDGGGLNLFDRKQGSFTCYKTDPNKKNSISSNLITTLCPTDGNKMWVGSEDALDLLNLDSCTFQSFKKTLIGQGSLNNNTILSLKEDNNGILWVGTSAGGINKYDRNLFSFDCYRNTSDPYSLSTDMVTSFAEDQHGDIWIGTDGGGLCRWEQGSNRFYHYHPQSGNSNTVGGPTILSLLVSRKKDYLWIGTYGNGLNRLDLKTGRFQHYLPGPGPHDLSNASIYTLLEDQQGNIWMGTNGGGVDVLNPSDGAITKHRHTDDPDSLSNDFIRCLHQDRQGKIWIGTYSGGISVYDPASGKFTRYDKINNHLSNQVVYSLCEDAQGNIWAGTMGGGLNWFDPKTHLFVTFNEDNGLNNNIVNSIVEDAKGYLWLSTNKGISRFHPATRTFRNYGVFNGLQDLEFIVGSGYRTSNGRIFFGGANGFNVFDPSAVRDNKIPPVSRLTGFLLFNKPAGIGERNSPLTENIEDAKEITLTYDQSDFTIEYAALSYTVPSENKYAYQLQGFDKNWNYVGGERKATYTNLVPGRYLFKVRAANNDGVWNAKETTLTIIITPPFWKTWWAYSLYILLITLLLYIIYKDIADKEKLKGQVRFERLTAEKMKELNRSKINFFTNVSHELRTPLSLIMDPLRKIIREELPPEQVKKYSGLMYNNASRLMTLINQMLDLRKLEAGHTQLAARPVNIVTATRNIAELFNDHAVERNIHYSITTAAGNLTAWIDHDKFEKIIFNLISNAFKYTPERGSITISIDSDESNVLIQVRDTGVGIPAHLKDRVFEIFYQVEETSRFEQGSTGIGLALTKELVELHKGHIEVQSQLGRGSDFIIYLPLGNQHLTPNEQTPASESNDPAGPSESPGLSELRNLPESPGLVKSPNLSESRSQEESSCLSEPNGLPESPDPSKSFNQLQSPDPSQSRRQSQSSDLSAPISTPDESLNTSCESEDLRPVDDDGFTLESTPLILLVEDNTDLREYLKEELGRFYKMAEAPNGSIGYDQAVTLIPDLIISDIMMPEINGLQLCEKIKNDERTSHIPVILLTAKQADIHQIEGYTAGADAYIPKPFNTEVVLARIGNLLASRKKLRERYSKTSPGLGKNRSLADLNAHQSNLSDQSGQPAHAPSPPDLEINALEMNALDKAFLNKAIRIVEDNLADITFDIDILSAKLKVSRRQLYRKLKALTDQTAHDFVTAIRLQKAADLLISGEYSIAEIAYKVGFSEPANFTRSFTRQFGKSPKKFIAEYKGN